MIIYEDNHLLVINKPAGWLVQGDKTGDQTLTDWGKNYLKEKYNKPGAVFLTPAHRIDRPVSGAVLFARTDKALGRLAEMFRKQEVEKEYYAIVNKQPTSPNGILKHYLVKDEQRNVVKAYLKPIPNAKESITAYESIGKIESGFLLRIKPSTGRAHQIRVQLASIGCAIIGDLKYGAHEPLNDASIGLHCLNMTFVHPVQKEILKVEAELPNVFWWKI
jgi:23S rRNA pseudouridine1911/1915/1917 synthase